MRLISLELENIRSYEEAKVDFVPGISLFEGDIGSGKSTILLGIEFALFGLGDSKGSHLLRKGEKEGHVKLELEVKNKVYTFFRSLRKSGKNVTQKAGYIEDQNGLKSDYSVTEMKQRVLQILDFNEKPQAKTTSRIYRYAIFTPQEKMKEILQQSQKERLETLRRAFGIDEYSIATKNTSIINRNIRARIREKLQDIENEIQESKDQIKQLKKEKENIKEEIDETKTRVDQLKNKKNQTTKEIQNLQPQYKVAIKLEEIIPKNKEEIEELQEQEQQNIETIQELEQELSEINQAEKQLEELKLKYQQLTKNKKRLRILQPEIKKFENLEKRKNKLETKIETDKEYLQKELEKTKDELKDLKTIIAETEKGLKQIPILKNTEKLLQNQIQKLEKTQTKIDVYTKEISKKEEEIKNKKHILGENNKELRELEEIGIGAPCPKCKQKLTQKHHDTVIEDYQNKITKTVQEIQQLNTKLKQAMNEKTNLENETQKLPENRENLTKIKEEIAALNQQEKTLKKEQKELGITKNKIIQLTEKLKTNNFSIKQKEQLQELIPDFNKLKKKKTEYSLLQEKISTLEEQNIETDYVQNQEKVKRKTKVENDIEKREENNLKIQTRITNKERNIETNNELYEDTKNSIKEIKRLEKIKDQENQNYNQKYGELSGLKERQISKNNEIKREQDEQKQLNKKLVQKQVLEQIKKWLDEFYIPALENIEAHVLMNIQSDFNREFKYWFHVLFETSDITVRLEEFTPIIEQNGYELEIQSLSGGEKTTVALAYRLALNIMVKHVSQALETNLLILDEPTDGFSKQQLNKLRDALNELNSEQVIMVSHEKELESFVDHIYKITKTENTSRVEKI
ncbi:MAG: AAA family ATPase [Candidatus Ranarchaeia archaeon]